MKILHIISELAGGGRERRMAELVKSLAAKGYDISVALVSSANNRQDYKLPESVNISYCGGTSSRKTFYKNLQAEVDRFRPDIVHLWSEVPTVLLSVYILKIKYGFKLVTGFLADGNPVKKITCRIANQVIFNASEAIVSNSKAGIIAKRAPLEKSHVIYNGFNFNRFEEKPFDREMLLRDLGIKGKRVVAMFARFSPAKNWDMFIRIAEMAKQNQRNDIHFLAVGTGDLLENYQERASQAGLKNISFLGIRNDVENLLQITDVVFLLSNNNVHAEGVSNSIMEAMAAARPVIATDGGGTPEIIENGKSGYIVEPDGLAIAYDLMISCLDDTTLSKSLGDKGREIVREKFTLTHMTEQYMRLYTFITKD